MLVSVDCFPKFFEKLDKLEQNIVFELLSDLNKLHLLEFGMIIFVNSSHHPRSAPAPVKLVMESDVYGVGGSRKSNEKA